MYSVTGHMLRRQADRRRAMTLTEMVMAMALLSVVFAVLMPQFRILHRSWGLREASAESLQNGRVLLDHMQSHLATAAAITDVSDASDPMGFIEYQNADGDLMRYETGADDWVYFGPAGSVSALAGPVSELRISGYAADDLQTAVSDPAVVRLLRVQTTFSVPKGVGKDREFSASMFLRKEQPAVPVGGGGDDDGDDSDDDSSGESGNSNGNNGNNGNHNGSDNSNNSGSGNSNGNGNNNGNGNGGSNGNSNGNGGGNGNGNGKKK